MKLERGMKIILALAAVRLLVPLFNAEPFGYFRDELYYLVCGLRPDWGYVDHPPMAPLLAVAGWKLFGETLYGLRFFPALFGAITVALTGAMSRRLGAGTFGQVLAALTALLTPFYIVVGSQVATDSFQLVFWAGMTYAVLLMLDRNNPRMWLWFGLWAGLGLQAKHSTVFFGFALLVGLALTRRWDLLLSRWILAGGAVAFAIALPNVIWQWQHGWPTWELLRNVAESGKNIVLNPLEYLAQQIFLLGPPAFPLWLGGLVWLLRGKPEPRHRVFAYAWLVTLVVLVLLKGKNYYLAPAYPMLFAAGAAGFERWTAVRWRRMRPAYVVVLVAVIGAMFPIGVPVMSPETTAAYQEKMGITPPRTERSHTAVLPQHLGDRLGWEEMVATVARVYDSLPPEERAKAGVFAQNFGEAGAIDILGRKYGLPPALSGNQNYFFWGPRGYTGEVLIVLDDDDDDLTSLFASVEDKGPVGTHSHAMPYEKRMRIYLCRGMKQPLAEFWPRVKWWL
jgi:hypothetical protein